MLPRAARLLHLETLRAAFEGTTTDAGTILAACEPRDGGGAEAELLARLPEALERLERLAPGDRVAVRDVLATLTSGMAFDLNYTGVVSKESKTGTTGTLAARAIRAMPGFHAAKSSSKELLGKPEGKRPMITRERRSSRPSVRKIGCVRSTVKSLPLSLSQRPPISRG